MALAPHIPAGTGYGTGNLGVGPSDSGDSAIADGGITSAIPWMTTKGGILSGPKNNMEGGWPIIAKTWQTPMTFIGGGSGAGGGRAELASGPWPDSSGQHRGFSWSRGY